MSENAGLQAALLYGGRVAELLEVPGSVLRRMARQVQARAMARGILGPCRAELRLPPLSGAPRIAAGLEFTVGDDRTTYVIEYHTLVLDPLLSAAIAQLKSGEHPENAGDAVSYVVIRPEQGTDCVVWEEVLPEFALAAAQPAEGHALWAALASAGAIAVLADPQPLREAVAYCHGEERERGGALLGRVCRASTVRGARLWLEVLAFAPADGADERNLRLTFNAAAWQSIEQGRREAERRLGRTLSVLGWVHGHPRIEGVDTPFFLSTADLACAEQAFAEPWCLTVITDAAAADGALSGSLAVWGWNRYGVTLAPRDICVRGEPQEVT